MFKKASILLILCITVFSMSYGQYEDDAVQKGDADSATYEDDSTAWPSIKDKLVPGLEFMLNASSGAFYAELSPFVGYQLFNPLLLGVGVHGSFLGAGSFGNFTYYGAHTFARLTIAGQFFLHAELRLLNGKIPNTPFGRGWVVSPIAAAGIMYGESSYMLIGYAMNPDFQQINPFGGLVYRIGIYLN